jgi:hypothetical protein
VFFVMGDRDGVIQQYPKNGAWAEIKIYRGNFSQTTLEATRSPKFYLPKKFDIEDPQRCLIAQVHDA